MICAISDCIFTSVISNEYSSECCVCISIPVTVVQVCNSFSCRHLFANAFKLGFTLIPAIELVARISNCCSSCYAGCSQYLDVFILSSFRCCDCSVLCFVCYVVGLVFISNEYSSECCVCVETVFSLSNVSLCIVCAQHYCCCFCDFCFAYIPAIELVARCRFCCCSCYAFCSQYLDAFILSSLRCCDCSVLCCVCYVVSIIFIGNEYSLECCVSVETVFKLSYVCLCNSFTQLHCCCCCDLCFAYIPAFELVARCCFCCCSCNTGCSQYLNVFILGSLRCRDSSILCCVCYVVSLRIISNPLSIKNVILRCQSIG